MNMKYIIAVDLGGTITKVGLLRNGELVDYVKMPSRQDLDMTASLPEIENAIDFLLNSNGVKRLFGVGIAFPGLVNNKKSIIISTNEKYDDGVELDLDRWADEHWGAPFYIDNDARLAAIGEWQYGSGRGYDSVVMMTIGTGIGSGVIMNGEVMYGKHFQAGSLGGHFVVDYKGRLCSCGNKGCVEVNLKNRYVPVAEIGYGTTDTTDDGTNIHYKASAPYFRIGMNYNFFFKKPYLPGFLYGGIRYGFTSFSYDVDAPTMKDPTWGFPEIPFSYDGIKTTVTWAELLAGIKVNVYKNFYMGWSLRYRIRMNIKKAEHTEPWYIPGFGKNNSTNLGVTYSLIYKLPF